MKSNVIVFLFLLVFIDLFHPLFHFLPSFINSILNYEIQICLKPPFSYCNSSRTRIFPLKFTSLVAWIIPVASSPSHSQILSCSRGLGMRLSLLHNFHDCWPLTTVNFHYLPSCILNYEIQTCLNLHSVIVRLSNKFSPSTSFHRLHGWKCCTTFWLHVDHWQHAVKLH